MKFARLFRKTNLKVAVLSVVLAITLWFFKAMSNDYSSVIILPIKVVETGEYLRYGEPTTAINVEVSGKGWNLFWHSLGIGNDTVFIPLKDLSNSNKVKGREVQSLMKSKIYGLRVNSIKTDIVKINYDQLSEKTVSIRLKKKYKKRYYFDTVPTVSEKKIVLNGPKRAIDTLASSYTFGITDSMLGVASPLEFDLSNEYPEVVHLSVAKILVFYSFKSTILNTVPVKVKYLNLPFLKSLTANAPFVKLTYKVKVSEKDNIDPSNFVIYADVDKSKNGQIPLRVDYVGDVKLDITAVVPRKIQLP